MDVTKLVPKNIRTTRWVQFIQAIYNYIQTVIKPYIESRLKNKYITLKTIKENLKDLVERKGYTVIESDGYTSTIEYYTRLAENLPVEIIWLLSDKCYRYLLKTFWLLGETWGLELNFDNYLIPKKQIQSGTSIDLNYQLLDQEKDIIYFYVSGYPVPNPPLKTYLPELFLDTYEFPNLDLDDIRDPTNHFLIDYQFYLVEDKDVFISYNTSKVLYETVSQIHRLKEIPHYRVVLDLLFNEDKTLKSKSYTSYDFDVSKESYVRTIWLRSNLSLARYIEFGNSPYLTITSSIQRVNIFIGSMDIDSFEIIDQSNYVLDIEYKITEYGKLTCTNGVILTKFSEIAILDENFQAIVYVSLPTINFYEKKYTSIKLKMRIRS